VKAPRGRQLVMAAAIVAVAAAVIVGIAMLDSPGLARSRRIDRQRTRDLYAISNAVHLHWSRHRALPEDLRTLRGVSAEETLDPASRRPYEFRVIQNDRYELCATFEAASLPHSDNPWAHGAGRHCFEIWGRETMRYPY
jgi:hypothetical protein